MKTSGLYTGLYFADGGFAVGSRDVSEGCGARLDEGEGRGAVNGFGIDSVGPKCSLHTIPNGSLCLQDK